MLLQLSTAIERGGLVSKNGFNFSDACAIISTPILAIAGDRDEQCPPEAAKTTFSLVGSTDKKFILIGKNNGAKNNYGHFDLIIGRDATEEVFPHILSWLNAHLS